MRNPSILFLFRGTLLFLSISCFFFSDCFTRERTGYKFFSFRVRDIFNAIDVESCSSQCGRSYNCNSFSFNRYKSVDNCHVSDVDLRFSQNLLDDITSDPDWDLYRQTDNPQCSSNSGGSGGEYYTLGQNFY